MQKILNKKLEIDLDLAFDSYPKKLLTTIDQNALHLLSDSFKWTRYLTYWIDITRKNNGSYCPEIIKNSNSFSMGLKFTDDSTISELNSTWRKQSGKTDVLSFPIIDEDTIVTDCQCIELGDIVVSVQTAQEQAIEHNHLLTVELQWLVSHGLLHLMGWDHPNPSRLSEMLSLQKQLLNFNGNLRTGADS